MEDVREYYPLYLGCDVMVTTNTHGLQGPPNTFKGVLRGYTLDQWRQQEFAPALQVYISDTTYYFYKPEQVKLIVRRLDSMTEEEVKEIFMLVFGTKFTGTNIGHVFKGRDNSHWGAHSGLSRLLIFTKSCDIIADNDLMQHRVNQPKVVCYLLSKGFWLFGEEAFDKCLIIDSKTLNKEV